MNAPCTQTDSFLAIMSFMDVLYGPQLIATVRIIALELPKTAITGGEFDVDWSDVVADRDFITIVPVGAEEGTYQSYVYAGEAARTLTAPVEPGDYESSLCTRCGQAHIGHCSNRNHRARDRAVCCRKGPCRCCDHRRMERNCTL